MPKSTRKTQAVEKVKPSDVPRFQMSEMGYLGIRNYSGVTYEELKRELNFPNSLVTYKQMSYHSSVAAALTLFKIMINKVKWKTVEPEKATEVEKKQTKIIRENMDDMEHSWQDFITEITSMITYGFSVHEKVFRYRLNSSGSKYNDGLVGWRKLPIRSQQSIHKFGFSDDGRDILSIEQSLYAANDVTGRYANLANKDGKIVLPRKKFLLFRTGNQKSNPFGTSPLRDCYFSWKYLTQLEETEATGVQRDLAGLPVIYIPPQYMSSDATEDQVAIYQYYQNAIRNLQQNQQAGMILPQAFDPESKQPLFKMELLTAEGGKQFDTTKIKEYYKNSILTALFADILIMGQSQTGSYSLGSLKQSLTGIAVQSFLDEIKEVINNDLIKHTYERNGWDTSKMCQIDYDNLDSIDLEALSKAVQRFASTGMIEKDRPVFNRIRESIGVDPYPEDEELHEDLIPNSTSRASDGMNTPFSGTRTKDNGENDNDNNMDNVG